jgi:hypothetical protein
MGRRAVIPTTLYRIAESLAESESSRRYSNREVKAVSDTVDRQRMPL